jgi:biopolymer transport protein ExbB
MTLTKLIDIANDSGGTLYLMCLLLLAALTVIFERGWALLRLQKAGNEFLEMLKQSAGIYSGSTRTLAEKFGQLPHAHLLLVALDEPEGSSADSAAGHLEEALMHEAPLLDRSLWILDTVITLAPLLGLFGTIIGMFKAFEVLGDVQNQTQRVTGGIAEALIATACGLFIAMLGLFFFNWMNNRVRAIMHQLETIKVMLLNRRKREDLAVVNQAKVK